MPEIMLECKEAERQTGIHWIDLINGQRFRIKEDVKRQLEKGRNRTDIDAHYQKADQLLKRKICKIGEIACLLYYELNRYRGTQSEKELDAASNCNNAGHSWSFVHSAYKALREAVIVEDIKAKKETSMDGWTQYEVELKDALAWCSEHGVELDENEMAIANIKKKLSNNDRKRQTQERDKLIQQRADEIYNEAPRDQKPKKPQIADAFCKEFDLTPDRAKRLFNLPKKKRKNI